MSEIPQVPWRFGEVYEATDFVQCKNIAILEQAAALFAGGNGDTAIEKVARWIRDEFYYPLDNSGNPSASGQLLRHQKGFLSGYHFKLCVYYAWSLPNEVLGATKCGICIDTANLVGSVLRAKEVKAWVTIGDVMAVGSNTLLGRHAWIETPYHGGTYVLETTIHEPGVNNLVPAADVYDSGSSWAQNADLYYVIQAKYNEEEFIGEGPLGAQAIALMGLPANRVLLFGLEATRRNKPRKLYREWRQEEIRKEKLLKEAYRG